ncbi:MAG: NAD(P)-dependent alcohol dehydrogenase [Ferruginibacter sp.]|uniref:NAD(P)-dependent alcohol dehydrogenase n=1 Tax=Ferruginibacter sp. TaxID=1940288 RepID=UPI0026581938|nr:NAD(P)-dependent alcohol dehydrogenase [Ferruginibacter sp.]MDB5279159.1 NAD(P)-dependent alcohol dehydrogenase [Ferruginibacter sp.]
MIPVKAYAAQSAASPLTPFDFERRDLREQDVLIEILFSGVCHSDLHQARNEWGGSMYPMVPGHEIVGKVIGVGSGVTKFTAGQTAGIGVMIDSCRECKPCKKYMEQYCAEGMTGTYNGYERDKKTIAQGGYSTQIVCDERWVYHVSDSLDLAGVAPLLCAGITTYSPLKYAHVQPGDKVAVAGLGGLGHMAVKFAVAMGAEVTMLSTSPSKEQDARKLGAHHFVLSSDTEAMKKLESHFDVVLDAVSGNHDYEIYLKLLDLNGKLLVVGLPSDQPKVNTFELIKNRRCIIGSMIGGTDETQEMLDFCAEKNIVADVEVIPMQYINEAYERMLKNDVKYRFVIDMASLK